VNIFGCVQCKHISIFLVTFPNKHSFGIGLSTRASRLLHKCRENDTICVLKVAKLVLLWLLFGINDFVTSCASGGSRSRTAACFIIKGNVWWMRTFLPMATILALHHKHMKLVKRLHHMLLRVPSKMFLISRFVEQKSGKRDCSF